MHLLSAKAGGYTDATVTVRIEQEPADIVILSAADTTLSLLAAAARRLPPDFPSIRICNLMHLRQPASIDLYIDEVLQHARVIVVDHVGGESYWAYGIERLVTLSKERQQTLVLFSGDRTEDPNLTSKSTVPWQQCEQLLRYLRESGPDNAVEFLLSLGHDFLGWPGQPRPPRPFPEALIYAPSRSDAGIDLWRAQWVAGAPVVAVVFYRSHWSAGNTDAFDALLSSLQRAGLNPLPIALNSLKDPLCLQVVRTLCSEHDVSLILNTTAFATAALDDPEPAPLAGDIPVLQVIISGGNREDWQANDHGLSPRDIAMQVALPEVDGRIVTRAISFKGAAYRCERTQYELSKYQPDLERVEYVVELSRRWCRLRQLANPDKRVALIMANYPSREGRIGNGVGLDTPASVITILRDLQSQGYDIENIPDGGEQLLARFREGVTNEPASWSARWAFQSVSLDDYLEWFSQLPAENQRAVIDRWGDASSDPMLREQRFMISGLRLGKIFVGLQPARGYEIDPYSTYHSPDLVPPHHYLAFYYWLRHCFQCDALVHVGKHGNLEWLPGKSVALSHTCWPDALLGPMPHLYPFIVNDPGEGSQAKRRTQAVIVDHLMPPLTRAETYGSLQDLERQVDEYYEALVIDPRRADMLRSSILAAVIAQNLHQDLGIGRPENAEAERALLVRTDAYLCDLKESQIRDGLHIFGRSPRGIQRRDTLLALARFAVADGKDRNASLLRALSTDLGLAGFNPFDADWAQEWAGPHPELLRQVSDDAWRHNGDTRERLEKLASMLIEQVASEADTAARERVDIRHRLPRTSLVLERLHEQLQPALDNCGTKELQGLCDGLSGRFVRSGPSGAPSRGRPDVLPTGKNFYSIDTRAVPTPTAWRLGFASAAQMIERYLQEHGDYPRTIGLSVWGTATMRTGGDDIAQALALMGVRPVWAQGSHRVADFEILPVSILDRPRIDVTLRVSGFFRDAFTNVIELFDAAVQAVADLPESEHDNYVRARILKDTQQLIEAGTDQGTARAQAGWRVFGSKPSAYGAGLQSLIDSGNWSTDADLSDAYCAWGGYAYGRGVAGVPAVARFSERLAAMQLVVQNQDNREHDVLDSNDYYQFHGGMAAAVRHLSGTMPGAYHADHSNPEAPRIRTLREEIGRVIRSRVVNPKWIAGVKRHGYKGAFEIADTVDYLFAFDATAHVLSDYQYALVADAFVNDADTREFIMRHNANAMHDICERLLEAIDRELWESPGEFESTLRRHLLEAETQLEAAS